MSKCKGCIRISAAIAVDHLWLWSSGRMQPYMNKGGQERGYIMHIVCRSKPKHVSTDKMPTKNALISKFAKFLQILHSVRILKVLRLFIESS